MQDGAGTGAARYAAVFREGEEQRAAGAVIVHDDRLLLRGRRGDEQYELDLSYVDVTQVRIGRGARELLNGRPAIVLTRRDAAPVYIEPLGIGLLHELTDLLTALSLKRVKDTEQVTVVVAFHPGARDRVKELVAEGPPFDPARLGLSEHHVFVSATEAAFVLVGRHVRETLERALRSPGFWRSGLAWRGLITGPPQIADEFTSTGECVYSWTLEEEAREQHGPQAQ